MFDVTEALKEGKGAKIVDAERKAGASREVERGDEGKEKEKEEKEKRMKRQDGQMVIGVGKFGKGLMILY